MKTRVLVIMLLLVAAGSALRPTRAQAPEAAPAQGSPPAESAARRVDSYNGRLGHCDWTARLDNFAIELQNGHSAKGLVVSYSPPRRESFAPHQLRFSRHYLTETRGLDASRLILVDGGTRQDLSEGLTELWLVPEGAEPPVALTAEDKYAQGFSGLFDGYQADLNVYQWMAEMGTPDDDIARSEFARKLKQQPDSVGYLVIRTPKGGPPGAWLRLARRDEQLLAGLGVAPSRLKSLDGGASEGERATVELWVLPAGAPPPVEERPKVDWTLRSPMKLHTYENMYGEATEDSERWMLDNLAEFLRENPRASALLVAREQKPYEEPGPGPDEPPASYEMPAPEVRETPAEAAETSEEPAGDAEEEEEEMTVFQVAEEFRERLVSEYGIPPDRLILKAGPETEVHGGRINIWVVPEKGPWPDTSALDEDEIEAERRLREESGKAGDAPAPPPR